MTLILIGILVAAVTFGSGIAALYVQKLLPDSSRSDASRSVIGQVAALVSLLLAMLLGQLVGTSFGFFFTQRVNLDTFAAQILELDRALAEYGPETQPLRGQIKEATIRGYNVFWGNGNVDSTALTVAGPLAQEVALNSYLASLPQTSEGQKQAVARANQNAAAIEQTRLLMSLQVAGQSVPWQLVAIVAGWAVAFFFATVCSRRIAPRSSRRLLLARYR